jgi:hypothetical protein
MNVSSTIYKLKSVKLFFFLVIIDDIRKLEELGVPVNDDKELGLIKV